MTAAVCAAGRFCMKGHAMLIRKLVIGAICILLAAGLTPPFLFRKAREPFSGVFLAAAHREIGKDESLFF